MVINQKPRLSPSLFMEYRRIVDFKADFHHAYIRVRSDLTEKWTKFSFLVTEDDITQLFLQRPTDFLFLTDIVEGITWTIVEGAAGTSKEAQKEKKMVTINLETNTMQ